MLSFSPRVTGRVAEIDRSALTILVVDDEWLVLAALGEILRGLGYHVLQADSGPEAMRTCREYLAPIHILLTDVLMPGMNGCELARQVTAERADVRVIYMSGFPDDHLQAHGVRTDELVFVRKPFSIAVLESRVREVLGETRSRATTSSTAA
jgi:DNA-binding response OmpR family regulator